MATSLQSLEAITNPQQLELVLQSLFIGQTEVLKLATKLLTKFTRSEQCLPALLQQLQCSANPSVRQAAGVILRSRVRDLWKPLAQNLKEHIKTSLLQALVKEPLPHVRSAIVSIIGEVAVFEIPQNAWNDLPKFVMTLVKHAEHAYREVGFQTFSTLCETVGEQMRHNLQQLVAVFSGGLSDPNINVRAATLRSVESLVSTVTEENEAEQVQKLLPQIVSVAKEAVTTGHEEIAKEALNIVTDMAELKVKSFETVIPSLLQFTLEIAMNEKLDEATRDSAIFFVGWVVTYKNHIVLQSKALEPIFNTVFKMMLEPEEDGLDESDITPFRTASTLLDQLCIEIPSKHIFNPVVSHAMKLFSSATVEHRKAGISALGIVVEGCSETTRKHLAKFIPALVAGANDTNTQVREAACLAIGNYAQYAQPEIVDYFEQIMPVILKNLSDPSYEVKEKTAYALDIFCNNVGERIGPYLEPLMHLLVGLLQKGDKQVQELAIGSIANAANGSQKLFIPYCKPVFDMMKQLMELKSGGEAMFALRARATECIGIIIAAVGQASSSSYIELFMKLAIDGLSLKSASIREMTFSFFGKVAQALEENFKFFLPNVMQQLLEIASSDPQLVQKTGNSNVPAKILSGDDEEEDDEDDEEDDDDLIELGGHMAIRSSFIDEKAASLLALGHIAKATRQHFLPYLETTVKIFEDNYNYFHYEIRRPTFISFKELIHVALTTGNEQQIQTLLNHMAFIYVTQLIEEDDKECAALICEAISYLCKTVGKRAIDSQIDDLVKMLLLLLQKRANCNQHDVADDDADHDIVLMDAVSDCIDDSARAYGPQFEPHFKKLFPELQKYMKENRAPDDRVMAIGTLSEVSAAMQHACAPYVPHVMPIIVGAMKHEYTSIKRNSVYCAGIMCFYAKEQCAPYLKNILENISHIFATQKNHESCVVDNACGAVARIMHAFPQQLPLDQIFPIFLNALPLRDDLQENEPVFQSIMYLFGSGSPVVSKHIKQVFTLFARAIGTKSIGVSVTTQTQIVQQLQQFKSVYPEQFAQVVSSLAPEEKQTLASQVQ